MTMAKPSINEVRVFTYTVVNGEGPNMNLPVAHFYVEEHRAAANRSALQEADTEYGFRVLDGDGNSLAQVAPGWWPFIKKIIQDGAAVHSPHCDEDCQTNMGDVTILSGEVNHG